MLPWDFSSVLACLEKLVTNPLSTFIGGVAAGISPYLVEKFTDKRRKKEAEAERLARFEEMRKVMPRLIAEMAADIKGDPSKAMCELRVLPSPTTSFTPADIPSFVYFEREHHPHLRLHIEKLCQAGFLVNLTEGHTPHYRMTHEFIELLRSRV